jgi:hypothetical protein
MINRYVIDKKIITCPNCKNRFLKQRHAQKYCDDIKCKRDRCRKSAARVRMQNKRYEVKKARSKICRICGEKHQNYFDLCNSCRSAVASSIDINYLCFTEEIDYGYLPRKGGDDIGKKETCQENKGELQVKQGWNVKTI